MPAQNLWKVEIVNREQEGDVWHTIQSQVSKRQITVQVVGLHHRQQMAAPVFSCEYTFHSTLL